jgi:L-amino acid N-acyltransferase YncA
MARSETLKDGTKVVVRDLTMKDFDKLMQFYEDLPPEDRKYLRFDVTDRKVVKERLGRMEKGLDFRIAAFNDKDAIVASGVVELSTEAWRRGQGELRFMVAHPYQHKGLGMIMMRELYFLALQNKVQTVVVEMMRPQVAARNICHKMGFREEMLIPEYLRDQEGVLQDMIFMKSDLKKLLQEMEYFHRDTDFQSHR